MHLNWDEIKILATFVENEQVIPTNEEQLIHLWFASFTGNLLSQYVKNGRRLYSSIAKTMGVSGSQQSFFNLMKSEKTTEYYLGFELIPVIRMLFGKAWPLPSAYLWISSAQLIMIPDPIIVQIKLLTLHRE